MKNKYKLLYIILGFLIVALISIMYIVSTKYEDVDILSIKREYNLVFNSNEDTLQIPIYISRRNTFLSDYKEIESTSISNGETTLNGYLETIEIGSQIKYDDEKFYEYVYHVSFKSYDNFSEPIFINDGLFNISYLNGDKLSFKIGNLCLFFNTTSDYLYNDIVITKLSAVTNTINDLETIVGVNIEIYNNTKKEIDINSIKIENKYYELDYLNYENKMIDTKAVLKEHFDNYSYTSKSIQEGNMNFIIKPDERKELFIPIKYTNGVKYLDRFPLYINYNIDTNQRLYIQDDFMFIKVSNIFTTVNGVERYVYKYF